MKSPDQRSPLLQAHVLICRILARAREARDHGREFVMQGLQTLTGREILFRRRKANAAIKIGDGIKEAESEIKQALADDGKIDPTEAKRILAALHAPAWRARRLAKDLDLPRESTEASAP